MGSKLELFLLHQRAMLGEKTIESNNAKGYLHDTCVSGV